MTARLESRISDIRRSPIPVWTSVGQSVLSGKFSTGHFDKIHAFQISDNNVSSRGAGGYLTKESQIRIKLTDAAKIDKIKQSSYFYLCSQSIR